MSATATIAAERARGNIEPPVGGGESDDIIASARGRVPKLAERVGKAGRGVLVDDRKH
jgi:hypothetical protein